MRRLVLLAAVASVAVNNANTGFASITLNMTDGFIDQVAGGYFAITLRGNDDNGLPFVFTTSANENVNHPEGYRPPGTDVNPTFNASGLDLRNFSLSIDGNDVPLHQGYASIFGDGSFVEADGPALSLPNPAVTETLDGPVTFSLEFNIYTFGAAPFSSPNYIIAETGIGFVDLLAVAYLENDPFYEFDDVNYLLTTLGAVEEPQQTIPEPTAIIVWSFLGLSAIGVSSRRYSKHSCIA